MGAWVPRKSSLKRGGKLLTPELTQHLIFKNLLFFFLFGVLLFFLVDRWRE